LPLVLISESKKWLLFLFIVKQHDSFMFLLQNNLLSRNNPKRRAPIADHAEAPSPPVNGRFDAVRFERGEPCSTAMAMRRPYQSERSV